MHLHHLSHHIWDSSKTNCLCEGNLTLSHWCITSRCNHLIITWYENHSLVIKLITNSKTSTNHMMLL
jgi:hypothetical protein